MKTIFKQLSQNFDKPVLNLVMLICTVGVGSTGLVVRAPDITGVAPLPPVR